MFERIIVPLDGSSRAEQALPVAARIAHASKGSIHLLQVISPVVDYGGLAPVPMVTEQTAQTEMVQSMDYLNTIAEAPMLKGIPVTTEVTFGTAAWHILASAEARKANLIVLCSHGRTGFTRWALGSVAHQLVHQSHVPLLVLREHEAEGLLAHSNNTQTFSTLVPLDGSELAETALAPAAYLTAALAAPAHGTLHLVQVVKIFPPTSEEGFVSELDKEALQHAKTYLATKAEHLQAKLETLNLSVTYTVEYERDVATTLGNVAEHGDKREAENVAGNTMIAISTHGRSGLQRLIMGSVTDRLLNTTRLPMLIVRPHKLPAHQDKGQREHDSLQRELTGSSWVGLL